MPLPFGVKLRRHLNKSERIVSNALDRIHALLGSISIDLLQVECFCQSSFRRSFDVMPGEQTLMVNECVQFFSFQHSLCIHT